MRPLLTVAFIILLTRQTTAQPELYLLGAEDILQTDIYNPARFHQDGWHIALPSVLYNHYHTGPGYKALLETDSKNSPILKVSALREGLQNENFLHTDFRIETIKLKYGHDRWSVGFDHEIIYHNDIAYSADLVKLYLEGNQQFIGQSIDIGPNGQIYSLNSYGFLISHKWPKVTLGLKPRLLFGQHFGNTPNSSAILTTSDDVYQLILNTDYRFDNVGVLQFEDANFLNYQLAALDRWNFTSPNSGVALDVGIQLRFSDIFRFSLSMIDWGSINWDRNVRSYESRQSTTYEGVEIQDLFNKQSISIAGLLDSLQSIFDLVEEQKSLTFKLPTKWIGVANYQMTPNFDLALITYYQYRLHQPLVLGLQATTRIWPEWKFGTSLSNRYGVINLGFNGSWIRPHWIGYFAMDQLLAGFDPLQANQFNVRLGLNIHLQGTSFD